MTARDDILSAARVLTADGSTFSPAPMISYLRRRGSQYADSTIRTFVVSAMCSNAPDNHAIVYDDLVRVSRGEYTLEHPTRYRGAASSGAGCLEPSRG